ncbi:hypothetical protein [Klebsiella quasipneumoniae]|uniref:hypothetical protein n=1 Tax=Klebsiella quasipneumoniae TaxID=1463165 RepID=UPI002074B0FF|nr:hypothetical protein [Klebsiella quasipneumoniae]
MKVKTYSVNTFDAWLQTEGDDTTGSYVKYEDYAALAAECAALKSAIEFAEPWLPTCDEELLHRIEIAKQTPASDRIVAGIKADAIDEAAVELDRVDTVASTRVIGFKLREFSQQLREGAK